ncbi:MAG: DUF2442 domain-containing protein [Leptospiraceae bacterium]|nr:DUF2442 domain-containing protein [Leptospiraceae bacterium]MCK6382685.1 DUF2442 domain-containing protein [Leptospiraceae bacterium]
MPDITKIQILKRNKDILSIELSDGRTVLYPLKNYPMIKRLSPAERKKVTITGDKNFNWFTWKKCNEMFILNPDLTIKVD